MHQDLATLLEQTDQLREHMDTLRGGIQAAHDQSRRLEYDAAGINECMASIKKCVRLAGNNRMAALSARDMRKVMGELEESVERLAEFIG
ncbi:hypothetical protein [Pontibacterium sp.]|jgi:methyl-accepting chemotaxis protein|uniref:hypothetical protein n=1 Tax=Pontibacterium sp. TaxID=2036026 RepID=UPI0035618EDA